MALPVGAFLCIIPTGPALVSLVSSVFLAATLLAVSLAAAWCLHGGLEPAKLARPASAGAGLLLGTLTGAGLLLGPAVGAARLPADALTTAWCPDGMLELAVLAATRTRLLLRALTRTRLLLGTFARTGLTFESVPSMFTTVFLA